MENVKDSDYFKNLPKNIQESIMQSGVDFKSEEELRQFAENVKNS